MAEVLIYMTAATCAEVGSELTPGNRGRLPDGGGPAVRYKILWTEEPAA